MMAESLHSRAVVQHGNAFVEDMVKLPTLEKRQILVRVHYAAFNPTDMLAFDLKAFGDGAVLGCDFAGTVQELGSSVTKFSIGDKVAAFVWGGEVAGLGAFSELCIADEQIAFKIPSNITLEEAATIPLAATTAFLALFSSDCLGLKQNKEASDPVMILGGSTSVGCFAHQIAAIHCIPTLSICSHKNMGDVYQSGAKAIFDRDDPNMVQQVHESYPNLRAMFDTVGSEASSSQAARLLGTPNALLCTVRPGKTHTENIPGNVKVCDVFVFTAFLKEHSYRGKFHWPIHYENHILSAEFSSQLFDAVSDGKIKPRPINSLGRLSPDALAKAVELTRAGKVSNEKICFSVYPDIE
ncbi:chaperonin 10-like protein [Xylogone sp. PMI_703]|nr:chaperonin 10-like protein [Xylogone sp. PMI_703]